MPPVLEQKFIYLFAINSIAKHARFLATTKDRLQHTFDVVEFSERVHTALIVIRALSDYALVRLVTSSIYTVLSTVVTFDPQTCIQQTDPELIYSHIMKKK